ncbi:hypothetical protein Psi01_31880 [Planobispora siamensis]|uniref:Uncharacterized protein n=1 Tax=Planobispora siamensis TaxID=936338 RepID=A0A8J3SE77_9ACTN|nr:hypothetical protein Psi01_31880 [Planobispora siamensis]
MASTPPREASAAAAWTMRLRRWCWLLVRAPVDVVSLCTPGTPLIVDGPAVLGADVPAGRRVAGASVVACGMRIRTRYLIS